MKKLFILSIAGMMSLGIQNEANAAFPVQENAKVYVAKKSQKAENAIDLNNVYASKDFSFSKDYKSELKKADADKFVMAMNKLAGDNQILALILCIFLGGLGIHRFYLGYIWQGIVQLLTAGGFGIWWLIDLVRIITGSLQPKDGSYSTTF